MSWNTSPGGPRIVPAAIVAVVVISSLAHHARGEDILYYTDYSVGTDRMAQALTDLSSTYNVTFATSDADFQTKLQSGTYELGIFFAQNFPSGSYGSPSALANFAAAGGNAIYADWSLNNTIAAEFGYSYSGGVNQTSMTVTSPDLNAGLTNPLSVTNTGWGIFSTDLSGTTVEATFTNGQAAILRTTGGRVIVNGFLSDTVSGTDGVQLYKNEINSLLNGSTPVSTPLPASAWGGMTLLAGLGIAQRLRRRQIA